jgi:hypothetical protein
MLALQGKFARFRVVVAAALVGATCFYFIQNAYPTGGFARDLFGVAAIALVGIIASLSFAKEAQRKYLLTLGVMVAIMFMFVCSLKLYLKHTLVLCYSATKVCEYDGDDTKPHVHDSNHATWAELAKKYWENY